MVTHVPYLSLVIPTHNRAPSLKRLLDSLLPLQQEALIEIVVVDNNSKDATAELAKSYGTLVRYIFEGSTSFTRARHTGALHACGEVLVYLDDDVIVREGTLAAVEELFKRRPECGVASGKILPMFEQEPSEWVLELQRSFNGWSLFDLGDKEVDTLSVPGPLMAIRKKVYEQVGGFPPDTLGVETNNANKTFKKLYVGPGDYGFCRLCTDAGYKVVYNPKMSVYHVIPPVRLTREFWLSRMIGEGHCAALTKRNMSQFNDITLRNKFENIRKEWRHFWRAKIKRLKGAKDPLISDEMWYEYYRSMHSMGKVLDKNQGLSSYIWQLGKVGVQDNDFDYVVKQLPQAYRELAL